jgi:dihydrofolate reductase
MRLVRYNVAASLDGYIAGPKGEFDWIPLDPTVDFAAIFAKVDTILIGRATYEAVLQVGDAPWPASARVCVFSRKPYRVADPAIRVVGDDAEGVVRALRAEEGDREIWLFGGGQLFRSLLSAGLVDRVEVTVCPILLGSGIPLLLPDALRSPLRLIDTRVYPSGMVTLRYEVLRSAQSPARQDRA